MLRRIYKAILRFCQIVSPVHPRVNRSDELKPEPVAFFDQNAWISLIFSQDEDSQVKAASIKWFLKLKFPNASTSREELIDFINAPIPSPLPEHKKKNLRPLEHLYCDQILAKILIDYGADKSLPDAQGITPVHSALVFLDAKLFQSFITYPEGVQYSSALIGSLLKIAWVVYRDRIKQDKAPAILKMIEILLMQKSYDDPSLFEYCQPMAPPDSDDSCVNICTAQLSYMIELMNVPGVFTILIHIPPLSQQELSIFLRMLNQAKDASKGNQYQYLQIKTLLEQSENLTLPRYKPDQKYSTHNQTPLHHSTPSPSNFLGFSYNNWIQPKEEVTEPKRNKSCR